MRAAVSVEQASAGAAALVSSRQGSQTARIEGTKAACVACRIHAGGPGVSGRALVSLRTEIE
jgi:hypothetical protein